MSLIKWEPFEDLDNFFSDFPRLRMSRFSTDLAVDVYEQDNKVVAEMNLPGIDPEKIDVSVENDQLKISGSHEEKEETNKKDYYSKEIRKGSFQRVVPLPCYVKSQDVDAEYHNGVLTVKMEKTEESKQNKVEVKVKKTAS